MTWRPPSHDAPPGRLDSKAYWDHVATQWDGTQHSNGWRLHSDAVDVATCERWWPSTPVGRALKTDLFDEIAGRGLLPDLQSRMTRVVGLDVSFHACRIAAQRTDALVANTDVRALPFAGGSFNLVISNSTLDHFSDVGEIERAMREIHRVLATGGRLILTLDNPANPVVALRNLLPIAWLHRAGLVPYYVGATMAAPQAARALEASGFTVREVTAVMHCPRALAIVALRALDRFAWWRRRLPAWLMACERLERSPTRFRTGYFVALVADKERA